MLNAFVRLMLGHLFGDFVLQNSWIAANKVRSRFILSLHTFFVFISHVIFAFGRGFNIWALILLVLVWLTHQITDLIKIKSSIFNKSKVWIDFLLDQLVHVVVLLGVAFVFPKVEFFIPFRISVIGIAIIMNSYFYSILAHLVYHPCDPYRRDLPGYIYRGSLPILFEISPSFAIVVFFLLPSVVFFHRERKREEILSGSLAIVTTILLGVLV